MSVEIPSVEEQAAELVENGWKRKSNHIWISPLGVIHIGPTGAWKVMRGVDVLSTPRPPNGFDAELYNPAGKASR